MAASNIVDRQIRNLRSRLRDDWRAPRFIATVAGHGYKFVAPLTDLPDALGRGRQAAASHSHGPSLSGIG